LQSELKEFNKKNKNETSSLRRIIKKYDKEPHFDKKRLEKVKKFLRTRTGKPLRLKNIK